MNYATIIPGNLPDEIPLEKLEGENHYLNYVFSGILAEISDNGDKGYLFCPQLNPNHRISVNLSYINQYDIKNHTNNNLSNDSKFRAPFVLGELINFRLRWITINDKIIKSIKEIRNCGENDKYYYKLEQTFRKEPRYIGHILNLNNNFGFISRNSKAGYSDNIIFHFDHIYFSLYYQSHKFRMSEDSIKCLLTPKTKVIFSIKKSPYVNKKTLENCIGYEAVDVVLFDRLESMKNQLKIISQGMFKYEEEKKCEKFLSKKLPKEKPLIIIKRNIKDFSHSFSDEEQDDIKPKILEGIELGGPALNDKNEYILGGLFHHESISKEFKSLSNVGNIPLAISRYINKYISGFLNSTSGGTIYFGILNNGHISGLFLNREMKDEILRRMDDTIDKYMKPRPNPNMYTPKFVNVVNRNNIPIIRSEDGAELTIFEIDVKPGWNNSSTIYQVIESNKEICYIRKHGSTRKLEGSALIQQTLDLYKQFQS